MQKDSKMGKREKLIDRHGRQSENIKHMFNQFWEKYRERENEGATIFWETQNFLERSSEKSNPQMKNPLPPKILGRYIF